MKARLDYAIFGLMLLLLYGCAAPTTPAPPTRRASPTVLPTALPPLAAELVAVAPQQFPPTAPIRIRFTQPMNADSAQPAAFLYPFVSAEMRWNAAFTELTLQPYTALQPMKDYRVFVHQNLRSQSEAMFAQQPEWMLTTAKLPRVFITHQFNADPTQLLDPDLQPTFLLNFDTEMEIGSVQTALRFEPSVAYTLEWQENTLRVALQESLPPATTLDLYLDATAHTLGGVSLAEAVQYHLSVPSAVREVKRNTQKDVAIYFNYPIDSENFTNTMQVTDSSGQLISGRLKWGSPRMAWFMPEKPLDYGVVYTVTFTAPLKHENGTLLDLPSPVRIVTPPPVTTFNTDPQKIITFSADEPLQITFLVPTDHASVESALHFSPPVSGTITWQANTERLVFTPTNALPPYVDYQLTLETTARRADGRPLLLEPLHLNLRSGYVLSNSEAEYADVSFGSMGLNLQMLDVNGRRAVRFWLEGDSQVVKFSLYRISLEQLLQHYNKDLM